MCKTVGQSREIILVIVHLHLFAFHAKRAVESTHTVVAVAYLERIASHGYGTLAVVTIHVHRHAVPAFGEGAVEDNDVVLLKYAVTR